MKKLIIASFVAALFAACNNTPAVTESATNLTKLTSWVDSIKNVIAAAPTHDSAAWAGYNDQFNAAVATIKIEELDEAGKTALTAATESWTNVGTGYVEMMKAEKEKAAAAMDTTVKVEETVIEKVKEGVKETKEVIKK